MKDRVIGKAMNSAKKGESIIFTLPYKEAKCLKAILKEEKMKCKPLTKTEILALHIAIGIMLSIIIIILTTTIGAC